MARRAYIAIDLKSFYASVECVERGLDPLDTNLVVADSSRTEKTICLAVSPSLKARGIPGRPRLFEVVQRVKRINIERKRNAPLNTLCGESYSDAELKASPELALGYITATPRMAFYMEYSTRIYQIYLKYVAPEDIHVYSVDEVFIDATHYLASSGKDRREFAMMMIQDVLKTTGITATAGIGTNLYLCKIAMDIEAKHIQADKDGARIAQLDEMSYRRSLWTHRPLTDFWRVGKGYATRLEKRGMFTMGDVARCSVENEDILYKLFGVNAELLIDHAWGWEACGISDIKAYTPQTHSTGSGQVLPCPYTFEKAKLIVREMADLLALDLVEKGLTTNQVALDVGYDVENLADENVRGEYKGEVSSDRYGRKTPKPAHGIASIGEYTSSSKLITDAVMDLYDKTVDTRLSIRRVNLTAINTLGKAEAEARLKTAAVQLDMFTDYEALARRKAAEKAALEREERRQRAVIDIQNKFGKNAILKGTSLEDGATTRKRNEQIGGHKK